MNLTEYDIVLINTSGGKDSQVMLDVVYRLAEAQGVTDRLVAVHADLGRVEWQGTRELAEKQCSLYGVRFEAVKREQGDLLTHVEQRGMFPSSQARYCTSDHKRGPVCRVMTKLVREIEYLDGPTVRDEMGPVRILNCMGLRAQESTQRAKKQPFIARDPVYSNKTKRWVDTWLPIHHMTLDQVWQRIRETGVPHHYAYDLGMPRLSCVFCFYGPRPALLIAGEHNPELLNEWVGVERRINHTLRKDQSLIEIQTALANGERAPVGQAIEWMQCA